MDEQDRELPKMISDALSGQLSSGEQAALIVYMSTLLTQCLSEAAIMGTAREWGVDNWHGWYEWDDEYNKFADTAEDIEKEIQRVLDEYESVE